MMNKRTTQVVDRFAVPPLSKRFSTILPKAESLERLAVSSKLKFSQLKGEYLSTTMRSHRRCPPPSVFLRLHRSFLSVRARARVCPLSSAHNRVSHPPPLVILNVIGTGFCLFRRWLMIPASGCSAGAPPTRLRDGSPAPRR